MGTYINIGNAGFKTARSIAYVDKSGLIDVVNRTLFTARMFSCVTRCRRFGKSMAAMMLNAYYDHSCDSRQLFEGLQIADSPTFEQHLNKYPVIYLDMTEFVTRFRDEGIVKEIDRRLRADVLRAYPQVTTTDDDDLMDCLIRIAAATGEHFVFIIDEWDALCREFQDGTSTMDEYVNWLRRMFKSANTYNVFATVYMTGILPVKKYKTESALNNFTEFSMVEPMDMERFFGFTKSEVRSLAAKHNMVFEDLEAWYDGYQIGNEPSVFNPNSVMMALRSGRCRSYWATTGAFDAVAHYIQMNFGGLRDDVIKLLAGGRCKVDPTGFQNDMAIINSKNDVFTVLIHLGYLSYNWQKNECYIPNREVAGEMVNAVRSNKWKTVVEALERPEQLLKDTLAGDAEAVARAIEEAHDENTSILSYNDENSLACVLSIAYYYAHNDYIFHRELPTGKGFADLVLIPRRRTGLPAIVMELKCDADTDSAIDQIHRRQYPAKVADYTDRLLLVGINYDKKKKQHTCRIEQYQAGTEKLS